LQVVEQDYLDLLRRKEGVPALQPRSVEAVDHSVLVFAQRLFYRPGLVAQPHPMPVNGIGALDRLAQAEQQPRAGQPVIDTLRSDGADHVVGRHLAHNRLVVRLSKEGHVLRPRLDREVEAATIDVVRVVGLIGEVARLL